MANDLPFIRRRVIKRIRIRDSFQQISISESRRIGWSIWWATLLLGGVALWYFSTTESSENDLAGILIAIFYAAPLAFWALISLPLNNRLLLNGRESTVLLIKRYLAFPIKVERFPMRSGHLLQGETEVLEKASKDGCLLWCLYRLLGPIGLILRFLRYAVKTNTETRKVPAIIWIDQASNQQTSLLAFEEQKQLDEAMAALRGKYPDALEPTGSKRYTRS